MLEKLRELAPWHHKVKLKGDLFTTDGNQDQYTDSAANNISVVSAEKLGKYLLRFYPKGLQGKRLLDIGCNGGGYCIKAHQLGADFVFGFDPRKHWINQANYLKEYFEIPDRSVQFDIGTIDDQLPNLESFDVTLFMGVFYHLPSPIKSLIEICAKTRETIVIDSAIRNDIPEDCLAPKIESVEPLMSGVDGLSWYPGGPKVILRILQACGFEFIKVTRLVKDTSKIDQRRARKISTLGRMRIIASRKRSIMET